MLKREHEDISTGNTYMKERNVSFTQRISPAEFERQKKEYTDKQIDMLLKSPLYQKKRVELTAEKEN